MADRDLVLPEKGFPGNTTRAAGKEDANRNERKGVGENVF